MKSAISVGAVLLAFGGSSAMAADMAVKAPAPVMQAEAVPSWSGAYFGARGGYGWGDVDYRNLGGSATATIGTTTVPFANNFGTLGSRQSHNADGGILGYVSGINWQT